MNIKRSLPVQPCDHTTVGHPAGGSAHPLVLATGTIFFSPMGHHSLKHHTHDEQWTMTLAEARAIHALPAAHSDIEIVRACFVIFEAYQTPTAERRVLFREFAEAYEYLALMREQSAIQAMCAPPIGWGKIPAFPLKMEV